MYGVASPTLYSVASPTDDWSRLSLQRFDSFMRKVPPARAADMMSLKVYVGWGTPTPDQAASLQGIHSAGELHVYENPERAASGLCGARG